jgi:pimeloyl-ACP methyl ester carboxylesterase
MSGSNSPAIFGRTLDALQQYLPRSERVSLSGGDHFVTFRRPAAFNDALLAWLNRM